MKKNLILIYLILLVSCKKELKKYEKTYFLMNSYFKIILYTNEAEEQVIKDQSVILNFLKKEEDEWSITGKGFIYKLNSGEVVKVDKDVIEFLLRVKRYNKISEGKFNPMIGNLIELWGFVNEKYYLPKRNEIENCIKNIDFNNLIIDSINNKVYLRDKSKKVNFGGIAEGFIIDRCYELINNLKRYPAFLIDGAGDIRCKSDKLKNEWSIGLRNPSVNSNNIIAVIEIKNNSAIVTSGNYERYFEKNGVRYHHILDPQTGYPTRNAVSTTIIADNNELADYLSTTTMIFTKEKVIKWLQKNYNNVGFILIYENKDKYDIYVSKNIKKKVIFNKSEKIKIYYV